VPVWLKFKYFHGDLNCWNGISTGVCSQLISLTHLSPQKHILKFKICE
jgi:hypothetical protein